MSDALAAIDRALAAPADLHRTLQISCGLCGASVPFHQDTDVGVIGKHIPGRGRCTFAGHRICRLPVMILLGDAGMFATCSRCGNEETLGPDDHHVRLRWCLGCPKCGAGNPPENELLALKVAAHNLGKSERTVLRWAQARGAARRDGGRWLIHMKQLQG